MKTKTKTIRISEELLSKLKEAAEMEGVNDTKIIERALDSYFKTEEQEFTHILLEVYNVVFNKIQQLEAIRDCNKEEKLSKNGESLHKLLNEFWEKLRQHPSFWEPRYETDEFGETDYNKRIN